jgi:hypothetical protein
VHLPMKVKGYWFRTLAADSEHHVADCGGKKVSIGQREIMFYELAPKVAKKDRG